MAGGNGTRLRPLTCTVPKPMVRISGKPVIEYIFDLLLKHGIDTAYVTLGYLPQVIERKYENGYKNMKLIFCTEDTPLGTAGGVKNAASGCDDTLVVISGDAVCDFDLSGVYRFHKANDAKITVIGKEVEDPGEYGLINKDRENRIIGFTEKPSVTQAVSDLANTGVYIIEPDVLERIPEGKPFDFSRDLFPSMLASSQPLYCYKTDGYWCDVGSVEAYLQCQKDALDGKFATEKINVYDGGNLNVIPPVYIGENAEISPDAQIGPYACIEDYASISDGAKIRYSVVGENAFAGRGVNATGAILCGGCAIGKGTTLFENSVVGAGAVTGENSVIKPGVKIWPGKVVPSGANVTTDIKYGNMKKHFLCGDCADEKSGGKLGVIEAVKLGCSVAKTRSGKKTAVANDGTKTAKALANAFSAGAMACGAVVWDFGQSFRSQLSYLVSFCELDCGVFFGTENGRVISICGEGGLSLPRNFERSIEAHMQSSEFNEIPEVSMKEICDVSGVKQLYEMALLRLAPYGLGGLSVSFESENPYIKSLLEKVFQKLGGELGGKLVFNLDEDGRLLTVNSYGEEYNNYRLLGVACYDELRKGRDISVPYEAPDFLNIIAEEFGGKVYRYLSSPSDESDSVARRMASKQFFARDSLFLAFKILSIIKERETELSVLVNEIPQKYIFSSELSSPCKPSALVGIIGDDEIVTEKISEGIKIVRDNGRVLIMPESSGEKLRLLAEADTMEAAQELCVSVSEILASYNN